MLQSILVFLLAATSPTQKETTESDHGPRRRLRNRRHLSFDSEEPVVEVEIPGVEVLDTDVPLVRNVGIPHREKPIDRVRRENVPAAALDDERPFFRGRDRLRLDWTVRAREDLVEIQRIRHGCPEELVDAGVTGILVEQRDVVGPRREAEHAWVAALGQVFVDVAAGERNRRRRRIVPRVAERRRIRRPYAAALRQNRTGAQGRRRDAQEQGRRCGQSDLIHLHEACLLSSCLSRSRCLAT